MAEPKQQVQEIEQLKQRYEALRDKKSKTEGELKSKQQQLEDLQKQARDTWGTDDVTALEAKLEQMKRDNEDARRKYQESLDSIEAKLNEVDARYAAQKPKPAGK